MDIPSDVGSKYKFLYFRKWQNKHREKEYMPKSKEKNAAWFNRIILSYSSNSVTFIMKHGSSDILVTGHRYELDLWRSKKRNFSLRRHCLHWNSVPWQCPMHNVAGAPSPWTQSSVNEAFLHSLPFDSEVHLWCGVSVVLLGALQLESIRDVTVNVRRPDLIHWLLFDSESLVVRNYSTKIIKEVTSGCDTRVLSTSLWHSVVYI